MSLDQKCTELTKPRLNYFIGVGDELEAKSMQYLRVETYVGPQLVNSDAMSPCFANTTSETIT